MLDTAGTSAVAASTGSKKATLQKLMSFDMMEPGYPMDEEMMLEVRQVAMAEQIKAPNFSRTDKGQTKSKRSFQANVSSKKQTNEFCFTTMKPQVDLFSFVFWMKLKAPKRHFEIN